MVAPQPVGHLGLCWQRRSAAGSVAAQAGLHYILLDEGAGILLKMSGCCLLHVLFQGFLGLLRYIGAGADVFFKMCWRALLQLPVHGLLHRGRNIGLPICLRRSGPGPELHGLIKP
jgi:hypothetical protein